MKNPTILHGGEAGFGELIWDAITDEATGEVYDETWGRRTKFASSNAGEIAASREKILDVAEALINRFGHTKTTMENIAAKFRTSRTTLYRFFPSKEAIDDRVCARLASKTLKKVREKAGEGASPPDQLLLALRALTQITADRMSLEPQMHKLFCAAFQDQWPAAIEYLHSFNVFLDDTITRGVESGDLAEANILPIRRFVSWSIFAFIHPGLMELSRLQTEDLLVDLDSHVTMVVKLISKKETAC